ncbi:MAG: zinc ribbon domain-containing protein [Armatimonadota bacterium]
MPLYEYSCEQCGHTFEKLMQMKSRDENDVACPECGSDEVRRLISTFAIGKSSSGGGTSGSSCSTGLCNLS